jgi:hypothetical protein
MKTNLLTGVAVVGLLCAGGASTGSVATSSISTGDSHSTCPSGPANARLAKGAHVTDPNTVTEARAAQMDAQLRSGLATLGYRAHPATLKPGSVNVSTYVHVITKDDGTGGPTKTMIIRQMHVLNKAYAGESSKQAAATPFVFTLKHVDYTANSDWYHWSNPSDDPADDHEAKAALHKGTYRDLNVYIASLGGGLLGYATFPGGKLVRDGLVILDQSMPGGTASPYNEGDTATHEIGHWLGLFHTFQNGCDRPGDRVSDTPSQNDGRNIFNCMKSEDTCPDKPGLDPIHNFMNYSDDPCMDRFTAGQAQRMSDTWVVYRKGQ